MNILKKIALWTCLLCMVCISAIAQKGGIYGKIIDEGDTLPVIGANIAIKESDTFVKGGASDLNGAYSIDLEDGTYNIEISYVGNETYTKVITITGERQELNVTLQPVFLGEIVYTEKKTGIALEKGTISTIPVKSAMIENSNNVSMDQTIEKVPGVNVVGGQANIRGGSGFSYGAGSRVALLLDGMPILTGDAGFPYWDLIPIETVRSIEVIKGAASALYGSSALNGIINVLPAYPKKNKPKTKISLFGNMAQNPKPGVDGNKLHWWEKGEQPKNTGVSLFHGRQIGKFDLMMGGYGYYEDSWRATEFTRRGRVNANTRYRFTDQFSVGVNVITQYNDNGSYLLWNGDGEDAYNLWNQLDTTSTQRFQLIVDPFITYLDPARNSSYKWKARYFKNNNVNNTNQSILSDFFYNELQYQKNFDSIGLSLNAGVVNQLSYTQAELYADSSFSAANIGIYAQLDKEFFEKLNASFGVRYELNRIDDAEWDQRPVFRFGLNYELVKYTYMRASYGQGYRYPTIAERYVSTSLGILGIEGNPDLQSETGWSTEVGLRQLFKIKELKGFVDGALFWTQYQDMMEFGLQSLPGGGFGFYTNNIESETIIRGFEVTVGGTGDIKDWSIDVLAGYTYIDPFYRDYVGEVFDEEDNDKTDPQSITGSSANFNILKYRFKHTAKLDLQAKYARFSIGGAFRYNSFMEAIDQVFLDLKSLDIEAWRAENDKGSFVVDTRASFEITNQHKVSILCNNIFNLSYTVRPALIEAPRNFSLKYTYSIN